MTHRPAAAARLAGRSWPARTVALLVLVAGLVLVQVTLCQHAAAADPCCPVTAEMSTAAAVPVDVPVGVAAGVSASVSAAPAGDLGPDGNGWSTVLEACLAMLLAVLLVLGTRPWLPRLRLALLVARTWRPHVAHRGPPSLAELCVLRT